MKAKKTYKIIIDPRIQYNYASFYIEGLRQYFDKKNIFFNLSPFKSINYNTSKQYNSGLAIIIQKENLIKKIFIDTEDHKKIEPDRYDWCDLYAKVNPAQEDLKKYPKLYIPGASCGITVESKFKTIQLCITNFLKSVKNTSIPFKIYLRDYVYTFVRRRPLSHYQNHQKTKENYIFHASTLWYDNGTDATTNTFRGEFLKTCQQEGIEIEGGLFYIDSPDVLQQFPKYKRYKELYKDFLYDKRLSMDEYIQKTKESTFVFNTPSVCECHGWKLAEYLAMGKAIISVPLTREMPGEGLIHGQHVHFIKDISELPTAIRKINQDENYRKHLEKNARAYFDEYLAPKRVIERILEHLQINDI